MYTLAQMVTKQIRKAGRPAKNIERDTLVLKMYEEGKTYTEIGNTFKISRQRAAQIVDKHAVV